MCTIKLEVNKGKHENIKFHIWDILYVQVVPFQLLPVIKLLKFSDDFIWQCKEFQIFEPRYQTHFSPKFYLICLV